MAAGPYRYERGTGFPSTFYWVEVSPSNVYTIVWGGKTVGTGSTGPTSVTTAFGTFNRGSLKTSDGTFSYYELSKEYPVGQGPNTIIYGADYNGVQVKVEGILGSGAYYGGPTNGYGYGQTVASTTVSPTSVITAAQWDNLMFDLSKLVVNQKGNTSTYISTATTLANPGNNISYEVLSLADALADGCVDAKFQTNASVITITTDLTTPMADLVWGGSDDTPLVGTETTPSTVDSVLAISFSSQNQLHYFFNSNGYVTILGRRNTSATGLTAQEQAWYNLMPSLSATIDRDTVATLLAAGVGVEVTLDTATSSTTPYTGATAKIYAAYNTTEITVRVEFADGHTPTGQGPDYIRSGLVGYTVTRGTITGAFKGGFDGPVPIIVETNSFA